MDDWSRCLLRTPDQVAEFRERYASYIARSGQEYVRWIGGFPLCQWTDYLRGVPEGNIPVLIGCICILYIDRKVNVSFNETATLICRDPADLAEWEAWCRSGHPGARRRRANDIVCL